MQSPRQSPPPRLPAGGEVSDEDEGLGVRKRKAPADDAEQGNNGGGANSKRRTTMASKGPDHEKEFNLAMEKHAELMANFQDDELNAGEVTNHTTFMNRKAFLKGLRDSDTSNMVVIQEKVRAAQKAQQLRHESVAGISRTPNSAHIFN